VSAEDGYSDVVRSEMLVTIWDGAGDDFPTISRAKVRERPIGRRVACRAIDPRREKEGRVSLLPPHTFTTSVPSEMDAGDAAPHPSSLMRSSAGGSCRSPAPCSGRKLPASTKSSHFVVTGCPLIAR